VPESAAISIEALVVTPGRFGVMQENAAAPQTLGREVIETMPGLGEDIYRSVHRLPGVAADDFSARFVVRGGGNEELLVRLDGMTLFEPFHLKDIDGALSIVDVQAVGGVDLTTGGFTAEHGSRLTGVFDMRTLRQPMQKPRTTAGISLSNARLMSVGSFSARRGYLDIIMKLIDSEDNLNPTYHDALAKIEYQLSPRHVVSANLLVADDRFLLHGAEDDLRLTSSYANNYLWLNWRARLGEDVSLQTVLSTGRLNWRRDFLGTAEMDQVLEASVNENRAFGFSGVQQDWSWNASENHLLKWGFGLRWSDADYDYSKRVRRGPTHSELTSAPSDTLRLESTPAGREFGGYVAHRVRLADPLTAEVGLRYDHYSQSSDHVISPRLNVAWAMARQTTLRGAWGHFYQPQELYQLQAQDGDFDFHPAELAEHRVLGLDHTLTNGVSLRAEVYQRVLSRVRPRYVNLFNAMSLAPEAEHDRVRLAPTSGTAKGVEIFAARDVRKSKLSWYTSYALSSVEDVIEGHRVPRAADQRHAVLVELGYRPTPKWSLAWSWQMRTGRPYTASFMSTDTLPNGEVQNRHDFGPIGGERLPAYHRMDIRGTRRFQIGQNQLSVFVDVFNLYNRENVRGWASWLERRDGGEMVILRDSIAYLPRLPTIGVSWEF
jgi:outer membrane receptor protein involved in Fe transport